MRRSASASVAGVVLAVLSVTPALGLEVEVTFHNTVDLSQCDRLVWSDGSKASSFELQAAIESEVASQLERKGREIVERDAPCFVVTHVITDRVYPAGLLKVEVGLVESETLAWRGMATGVIERPDRVEKTVRRAIKRMFREFPDAQ